MRTTVLLLSVDEASWLRRSLPAAAAQPEATEIVVIDNACTDETAALAAEHGARVVRLDPPRRSYAAAINTGLRETGGDDAVLLLNADCVLEPGFLAAALPALGAPGVGSVAPKLLRAIGPDPAQRLEQIDAAAMTFDRRRKNSLVGYGEPALARAVAGPAFGADGAAALYRRETLDRCAVGGEVLDEDMGLWASDADLAWRAQLCGWECRYVPDAVAWHKRTYSPSTRAEMSEEARRLQFRNRLLMIAKNDDLGSLGRDLPRVLAYELLAAGHVLLRERFLLRGYADAWHLRAGARRRGRAARARRARRAPFGLEPPA